MITGWKKGSTRRFSLTIGLKTVAIAAMLPLFALMITAGLAGASAVAAGNQEKEEWKIPADAKKTKNPIAANADSLAKGKAVYVAKCQGCHGASGDGNTPIGQKLKVPDMRKDLGKLTDGEMFAMITVGKKPMPPFEKLPADDRWQVVNYVRSIK